MITKIDQIVDTPLIEIGNRTIQPIAHLQGWSMAVGDQDGRGAGVLLRLKPTEIVVQEGEETYAVELADPMANVYKQLLFRGVAVAGFCLLVMWVSRFVANYCISRRRKNSS